MNRQQLETQFEILKNDVSGLIDTNYFCRLKHDEEGQYFLEPWRPIGDDDSRVARILGAICPEWTIDTIKYFLTNTRDNSLPKGYCNLRDAVNVEQKQCVTYNKLLKFILIFLRLDGVINFGKTELCSNSDPVNHLKKIIEDSDIQYKDTLFALIDIVVNDRKGGFISDDPHESSGEKLNKAIMLLSLLSNDDIIKYGAPDLYIDHGIFSDFFEEGTGMAMPYIYLGCPKALEIFKKARLNGGKFVDNNEHADKIIELFRETLENKPLEQIAFDKKHYKDILLQCANAGISITDWARCANTCMLDKTSKTKLWVLEHLDEQVAEIIMCREGYFMLTLIEDDVSSFESSENFKQLRKYIVDNGFLKDVWHSYKELDNNLHIKTAFYEIDTRQGATKSKFIRFYNYENAEYDEEYVNLYHIACGFDPEIKNKVYSFIPFEAVADEGYRLDMGLYNSHEYAQCKHPVLLKEILTPVVGTTGVYDNVFRPIYERGSANVKLCENPLDNYSEFIKVGHAYRSNGDKKFVIAQALFIGRTWPMKPTWISCKNLGTDGGIIIDEKNSENVRAYKVDQSVVYPWYLTYKLSKLTYQFNLRKNQDGTIDESQFLRMYIDLPSLEDQKKEVEDVINEEIERKRRQIGAIETLFNLSHTIGLPASRIQLLLGNLQNMCIKDTEISSQLKKITDNFDYIIRIIDSTSKDFCNTNDPLEELRILPVLESFISSFSSLPFGINPMIINKRIDLDTKVKINKTLFSVMMDNILRNAHRHGFDKMVSSEHKVSVELDIVHYEGGDHLMLSIRNNGRKMEEGFSIYDYISRGRHGKHTGNTGQGGYDIYQIVKKFKGYLGLRSDEQWNFIVDILIPVIGTNSENFKTPYPYGTLV